MKIDWCLALGYVTRFCRIAAIGLIMPSSGALAAYPQYTLDVRPEEAGRLGLPVDPLPVRAVCFAQPPVLDAAPPEGWVDDDRTVYWIKANCGTGSMGTPFPLATDGHNLAFVDVVQLGDGALHNWQPWSSEYLGCWSAGTCTEASVAIHAALRAKRGNAIGYVRFYDGTPVPNQEVHVYDGLTGAHQMKTTTDSDGAFDFANESALEVARTRHWVLSAVNLRLVHRIDDEHGRDCQNQETPGCRAFLVPTNGNGQQYLFTTRPDIGNPPPPPVPFDGFPYRQGIRESVYPSQITSVIIRVNAADLSTDGGTDPNRSGPGGNVDPSTGQDPRIGQCGASGLCPGSNDPTNPSVGSPIELSTGDVWFDQSDATVMGPRRPLSIIRSYHSHDAQLGGTLFGAGWFANIEQRLIVVSDKIALLRRAGGGSTYFTDPEGDGTYSAQQPTPDDSTLQRTPTAWIRSLRQGGTETYDLATGRWKLQKDLIQHETQFNWNGNRLNSVVLPNGRTLTFGYTHDDHPRTLSGPAGLIATYAYDTAGRLSKVTYNDGPSGAESGHTFQYDANSRIEYVRDLYGRVAEHHAYDANGRGTLSEGPDGINRYDVAYLLDGVVQVTDGSGTVVHYEFDEVGQGRRRVVRATTCPDCQGGGDVVSYDYYPNGTLEKIHDADNPEHTVEYRYDATDRLEAVTDPLGRETKIEYDGLLRPMLTSLPGQPTVPAATVEYEAQGPVSAKDGENRETTFGYTNGLLTSVSTPLGKTSTIHHDPDTGDVDWVEDADGRRVRFNYNGMGWRTHTKNALDHETVVAYDARGRVTRVARPDGMYSEIKYDYPRNEVTVIGADKRPTRYKYDDAGRLRTVRDAKDAVTEYKYDEMSRLKVVRDDLGRETIYDYNEKGQLEQVTYPGGATETYTYYPSGRLKTTRDRKGMTASYVYDPLGRPSTKTFSDGTSAIEYQYDDGARRYEVKQGTKRIVRRTDKAGWLLSEEQPNGTVSYDYFEDGARRQLQVDGSTLASYRYSEAGLLRFIDSGASTFEYVYDAVGRRDLLKYPNGIVADYTLDDLSQLTDLTIGPPGSPIQTWSFGRNLNGSIKDRTATGLDTSARSYRYDEVERLIAEIQSSPSPRTSSWGYDPVGNRTSTQVGLSTQTVSHNQKNQIISGVAGGSLLVAGTTEPSSRVDLWMDSNERPASGVVTAVQRASGEFEGAFASVDPGTHTFTIEATAGLGRLARQRYEITVTGETAFFSYDANGNLTEKAVTPDQTWKYVWDSENQLRHVCVGPVGQACTPAAALVSFDYDPVGRRVAKTLNGVTHSYLYDGSDIVRETVSGGATYSYLHGTGVDEPLARADGSGARLFFHADDLGSVRLVTGDTGAVAHTYNYDAWGNLTADAGPSLGGVEYAYTGREWDRETGLYYYRARYYDPKAGRFISEDPIGLAGGINMYEYVGGNPISRKDPAGLDWVDDTINFVATKENAEFWAGAGDNLSFGATRWYRNKLADAWGWESGAVDECSSWYSGGQAFGAGVGLAMGGAQLGRTALYQANGNIGRGLGRLFYDNRAWPTVRSMWSKQAGGLRSAGQSLDHVFIPQRWTWVPQGIRNAGFNYVNSTAGFNSWKNGQSGAKLAVEWAEKGVVAGMYGAVAGAGGQKCGCQ